MFDVKKKCRHQNKCNVTLRTFFLNVHRIVYFSGRCYEKNINLKLTKTQHLACIQVYIFNRLYYTLSCLVY